MERNLSLDILKLLIVFMIVGLHTEIFSEFSELYSYLTVNGIFRISVPVFLIINGFYFYAAKIRNDHMTWLKRMVVLYLVWMLFYTYFWFSFPTLSIYAFIKLAFKFLNGYYHLWYISNMIVASLIMIAVNRFNSLLLSIFIAITFITGVAIQYSGNYHIFYGTVFDELFNKISFHRNFLLFSFPFFCIGYLINKHSLHKFFSGNVALTLSLIGLLLLLIESYFNFYNIGRDGGFDNLASLILVCPFVFILFKNKSIVGKSKTISLFSTAIYLIHIFIMLCYQRYTGLNGSHLTAAVLVTSLLASWFLIQVNRKVKIIL